MSQNIFGEIRHRSLGEIAAERIADAIVEGRLAPGARICEAELAAQMGISRSPLREALYLLVARGLVVRRDKWGTFVWEPDEADVDEIFSLRVVIESLAAEWAMPRLTREDFAQMEVMLDRQRELIESEDFLSLTRENRHFHEYICLAAGHSRLIRWWGQLADQFEVLAYRRMRHDPLDVVPTVLPAHEAILEALRQRDLSKVKSLHVEINRQVSQQIKEALRAESTRKSPIHGTLDQQRA